MQITFTLAAMIALLALALGINVGRLRGRHKVFLGNSDHVDLFRAQRAHGNLIEWAPIVILLIGAMEYMGADKILLIALGETYFIARICHAFGVILEKDKPHPLRAIGALGNVIILVWASIYILTNSSWP